MTYHDKSKDKLEPITALRSGVPMELERIVNKCLQKEPSARYQHADELLVDLQALQKTQESGVSSAQTTTVATSLKTRPTRKMPFVIGGLAGFALLVIAAFFMFKTKLAETTDKKSIAVLPFVNMSSEPENEYFTDGLTEEILNSLARLPELRVTSRTSSFHFKDRGKSIVEIAKVLGVSYVVEGSVRRADDQLRVTAQLIRADDGFHVWSDTYGRPTDDVFSVQEDIAESIAKALDIFLDSDKRSNMFAAGTRDVEAFEAFLRGRALYDRAHQFSLPEDHWEANRYLEKAFRLDPSFSAAYSLHHDAYAHLLMQDIPATDNQSIADEEVLRRIRLDFANANRTAGDPRLKLSTRLSGAIYSDSWGQVPTAVKELEAFVETGQAEIRGPGWSHMLLVAMGRADLGLRRAQNEIRHDPMHPLSYSNAAGASMALGTFDEALSFVQRGYELSPDHGFLRRTEAITLALRGNVELAGRKLLEIGGVRALLGHAFAGDHASARRLALEAAEARPRDGEPIWVMAELGEATEVTRITRIIDTSPVAALSFLRLIYYSGGYICFDMKAAPNFRARLREAGIDPASLKPWVPLSKPKPKQAGERVKE